MAPLRAALFDMDGTLLDTLDDIADAMNVVLERRGLPRHPTEAYKGFIGDGVEQLARRVQPGGRADEETVVRYITEFREEYARRDDARTRPYPGIPELLDGLVGRGMSLAILSNKPHGFTVRLAQRLLVRWPFDPVLGSRRSVPKKPDPTAALQVAGQLGIPPEQWLYLGDTRTDMETAVGAGMLPVGVLWGFRGADELAAGGARHIIERPGELLALLS